MSNGIAVGCRFGLGLKTDFAPLEVTIQANESAQISVDQRLKIPPDERLGIKSSGNTSAVSDQRRLA